MRLDLIDLMRRKVPAIAGLRQGPARDAAADSDEEEALQ
jgi:hypothetical protein